MDLHISLDLAILHLHEDQENNECCTEDDILAAMIEDREAELYDDAHGQLEDNDDVLDEPELDIWDNQADDDDYHNSGYEDDAKDDLWREEDEWLFTDPWGEEPDDNVGEDYLEEPGDNVPEDEEDYYDSELLIFIFISWWRLFCSFCNTYKSKGSL